MKSLLTRDIPPRAALAVVALVLFATVVTGREAYSPPPVAAPEARPVARAAAPEAVPDLDLEKLKRPRGEEAIANLFAPREVALPAASIVGKGGPAAPPVPTAPPLPFQYLGHVIDGDRLSVFLARGEDSYSVEAGQTIEGRYRVETITDTAVTFTYLPMGKRQVLAVPAVN